MNSPVNKALDGQQTSIRAMNIEGGNGRESGRNKHLCCSIKQGINSRTRNQWKEHWNGQWRSGRPEGNGASEEISHFAREAK